MLTPLTFPRVYWPLWDVDVDFLPGSELPPGSNGNIYAVIVIAFFGERVVMADIRGRGVCVPSGKLEPGETIDQAAVRETFEETGAHLDSNRRQLFGCYRMTSRKAASGEQPRQIRYSVCFVAEATHFEPIPPSSESDGYFLLAPEDVADHYFIWDDLLAAVFDFASAERNRLFPIGEKLDRG
jgi:8-oxo-dGTP diphosphatase